MTEVQSDAGTTGRHAILDVPAANWAPPLRESWRADLRASIVVFLVALPLCLGVALASGAPLFSGIVTGIIGGIVVGFASGSHLMVSGPAAGLTAIVLSAITTLGSFTAFLTAVFLAGLLQVGLGWLRAGVIGYYFPNAVIRGMLAGIGIIIVLKQLPHALGYDADYVGDETFVQPNAETTFSSLASAFERIEPGALVLSVLSLAILVLWERPFMKRFAIVPAALTILLAGEQATYKLLILSQVVLSLQLPFAVIPLIHFTSDKRKMGPFANKTWVRVLAWLAAAIIVSLNLRLAWTAIGEWVENAGSWRPLVLGLVIPLAVAIVLLLLWVTLQPWLRRRDAAIAGGVLMPDLTPTAIATPVYRLILVPLDHTTRDRAALSHALSLARQHGSKLVLMHVEEGVTSRVYGPMASTAEVEEGRRYFLQLLEHIRAEGVTAELKVVHSTDTRQEIVRAATELKPDLVIMGAHGHKGIEDIIFGATINGVRHDVDVPLLIVKGEA